MRTKLYLAFACLILDCCFPVATARKELKLLHVLSGNKFYVPDFNDSSPIFEAPKNLTYSYYLKNAVEIPNSVKMHLYNLGDFLRKDYGIFLGSLYYDEVIMTQTMAFPVSIMAGELINAGLWPPVGPQIWNKDLAWQPVPFVYTPAEVDALLLGTLCPTFVHETNKVLKHYNLTLNQAKILEHIKEQGKIKVENPVDVSLLYLAIENGLELNQTYPDWIKEINPSDDLLNVTRAAYDLLSKTNTQRRLNGGSFLKRIINDSKNYIKGELSRERKINLYSGDDRNLAGVLNNLNIPFYELPSAGAALIFELYEEAGDHFIKVIYYTGNGKDTIPYTLEGCDFFCPLDKFTDLVSEFLPGNELSLCGSMVTESRTGGNVASIHAVSNYLLNALSILILFVSTKAL